MPTFSGWGTAARRFAYRRLRLLIFATTLAHAAGLAGRGDRHAEHERHEHCVKAYRVLKCLAATTR
jgi:hypothetical protein